MPETVITNNFIQGLRSDVRMQNNTEHLITCNGMRATEFGAVAPAEIIDGTGGDNMSWPFPQMFKGEGYTLKVDADVLKYVKTDGTLQTLPVYEAAPSGSQLLAATDFDTGWAANSGWSFVGTTAVRVPGTEASIVDTGTTLTVGLYRFTVNISQVNTTESSDDKIYVRIGADSSVKYIPVVGVNEFEVLAAGPGVSIQLYAEENVSIVVTSMTCYKISAVTDLGLVATDKPFHLVSFSKIWALVSDSMMLLCAPICGTAGRYYSDANTLFHWRIVKWTGTKLRAACNYNGRLYLSGFDASDSRYDSAEFQAAFDIFMKLHIAVMHESFAVDKNVVYYGSPLGGDVNWPFAGDLALFGLLDSVQSAAFAEVYMSGLRDGNQGFFELPLQGRVLRMERLGDALVCYMEDGVCLVQAVGDSLNAHTVKVISYCGLGDNGLVTCTDQFHMYVDRTGKLQFVSNEFIVRELGYEEYLLTLITNKVSAPPIASFDETESEAYFSNGAVTYVRSRSGLGQVWDAVTSLYQGPSGLTGAFESIAPVNGKVRIRTGAMDFGDRRFKQFHDAEIGAYDVTNLKIRVHFKNNHSASWIAGEWQEVIRGGFVILQNSGYEVSFELEFTPGANARIEYIKVNWQVRDQRNFRRQAGRI